MAMSPRAVRRQHVAEQVKARQSPAGWGRARRARVSASAVSVAAGGGGDAGGAGGGQGGSVQRRIILSPEPTYDLK